MDRNKKTIQITVFKILVFWVLPCQAQKLNWIPFEWSGYQAKTRYFNKSAIMINCKIDTLNYSFKMQFDLGATKTVIYGKTFQSFQNEFAIYENKLDTLKKFWYNGKQYPVYKSIDLSLGNVRFKKVSIGKYSDFGYKQVLDSIDFSRPITIGTIAPDLFKDKFLIIDYPNNRIACASKLPAQFKEVNFTSIKNENGRIFVPVEINGKVEYLLFDTGIAMFPLLTTQKNALAIAQSAIQDSIDVTTWGKNYFVFGNKINKTLKLGNKELPNDIVYYDKTEQFDWWFERDKFWGIIGNSYFKNNILIIDYKSGKLGVK